MFMTSNDQVVTRTRSTYLKVLSNYSTQVRTPASSPALLCVSTTRRRNDDPKTFKLEFLSGFKERVTTIIFFICQSTDHLSFIILSISLTRIVHTTHPVFKLGHPLLSYVSYRSAVPYVLDDGTLNVSPLPFCLSPITSTMNIWSYRLTLPYAG